MNVGLDLFGQARNWLTYAAELEGEGHDADHLAFRRDAQDFHNLLIVEQPNGDFADIMGRQLAKLVVRAHRLHRRGQSFKPFAPPRVRSEVGQARGIASGGFQSGYAQRFGHDNCCSIMASRSA